MQSRVVFTLQIYIALEIHTEFCTSHQIDTSKMAISADLDLDWHVKVFPQRITRLKYQNIYPHQRENVIDKYESDFFLYSESINVFSGD